MSAVTFSTSGLIQTNGDKVPASSQDQTQDTLRRIADEAEARGATPGAITRLKSGLAHEALSWLRGCGLHDLARKVEDVISS